MNEFGLIYVDLKSEIPPKWPLNTTKYRDEPPDLLVHYFQTNSYCLFSPFLRGF